MKKSRHNKKNRTGFSIAEMALTLIIFGFIIVAIDKKVSSTKKSYDLQTQIKEFNVFESAIKNNFEQIIEIFQPTCSTISSDSQNKWGWENSKCSETSVYPTFAGDQIIEYNLDLDNLSASESSTLVNSILSSFEGFCTLNNKTSKTLDLFCPELTNVEYQVGGAAVTTPHVLGSDLNVINVPEVSITLEKKIDNGNYISRTSKFTMQDSYIERRQISAEKLQTIRNSLKSFYETKLTTEVLNSPDNGLNSVDDEMVPWFWEIFGDSLSSISTTTCTVASGVCSNLDSHNIWRSDFGNSNTQWSIAMRRIVNNLLSGGYSYSVDGFNNMIYIYPLLQDCSANDISTCTISVPKVPEENYYLVKKPPYVSAVFIKQFKDKNTVSPNYGRILISY